MLGRNRAGQGDLYGGQRGWRGRTSNWFQDHPYITSLIAVVVLGWLTWWQATRIDGARGTVAQGWGTGLAVGILASLGLTALWVATLLATRARRRLRSRVQLALALILIVSYGICLRGTLPSNSPQAGPYVITSGIEVGEIAYAATYSAYFLVLVIVFAGLRLRLRRRAGRGANKSALI